MFGVPEEGGNSINDDFHHKPFVFHQDTNTVNDIHRPITALHGSNHQRPATTIRDGHKRPYAWSNKPATSYEIERPNNQGSPILIFTDKNDQKPSTRPTRFPKPTENNLAAFFNENSHQDDKFSFGDIHIDKFGNKIPSKNRPSVLNTFFSDNDHRRPIKNKRPTRPQITKRPSNYKPHKSHYKPYKPSYGAIYGPSLEEDENSNFVFESTPFYVPPKKLISRPSKPFILGPIHERPSTAMYPLGEPDSKMGKYYLPSDEMTIKVLFPHNKIFLNVISIDRS